MWIDGQIDRLIDNILTFNNVEFFFYQLFEIEYKVSIMEDFLYSGTILASKPSRSPAVPFIHHLGHWRQHSCVDRNMFLLNCHNQSDSFPAAGKSEIISLTSLQIISSACLFLT